MEKFDFSEALRRLKAGACVSRAGWHGKGMHVYLEDRHRVPIKGGIYTGTVRTYEPVLVMFTTHGTHQPGWLASQEDLLAEDWMVAG